MFKRLAPFVKVISILAILFMFVGCKKDEPKANTAELYAPVEECNLLLKQDLVLGSNCVMALGPKLMDFGFCNSLVNPYNEMTAFTEDFKSLCVIQVAAYQKKEDFCSNIHSETDEKTNSYLNTCIQDVAIAKKDSKVCSLVQSTDGKKGKGTNDYDFCIFRFAVELKDTKTCKELTNADMQGMCMNYAGGNVIINQTE